MANPFPFSSGDVLTAANLNAIGEGQTWTPQVTQGATSFTESVTYSQYWEINDLIVAQAFVVIVSGTGVVGNSVRVTLPIACDAGNGQVIGSSWIYDSSTAISYGGQPIASTTTYVTFVGDWASGSTFGGIPAIALSGSDQIRMSVMYKRG